VGKDDKVRIVPSIAGGCARRSHTKNRWSPDFGS
jgi:hypothetical protein